MLQILLAAMLLAGIGCSDGNFHGMQDAKLDKNNSGSHQPASPDQLLGKQDPNSTDPAKADFGEGKVFGDGVNYDWNSGANEKINAGGGSGKVDINSPTVVRNLTGSIRWDGRIRFCVDFQKGEVFLDEQASRLPNSSLDVQFRVQTNEKSEVTHYQGNMSQAKFPGDWRFVKSAQLVLSNFSSCTDNRRRENPKYSIQDGGTYVCINGNDEKSSQSGKACYDLNFNLKTG